MAYHHNAGYYMEQCNPYPAHQQHPSSYHQQNYYSHSYFCDFQFASGVAPVFPSNSPSVLTPTTLANLEQTFVDLNNQQADQSISAESGFVPPVINPIVIDPSNTQQMGIKREYEPSWDDDLSSCSSQDPDWNGPTSSKQYCVGTGSSLVPKIDPSTYLVANSRRPTGPRKDKRNERVSMTTLNK